jgi:hypothetical protein
MSNNSTIKCPNCKHEFPIGNALAQEIENDIRTKYLKRYNDDKLKLENEKAQLAKDAEQLKLQTENQEAILADKLRLAKTQLEQEAIKKAAAEIELQVKFLNAELTEKDKKLKESQEKELELLAERRKLKEERESLNLEVEKKLAGREKDIFEKAQKVEAEKSNMREQELKKQLEDQKKLIEEMDRKSKQGSMQLQGEVLELALEDLLRSSFPFDTVEEVAKGIKGADCVQHIKNNLGQACGKIIYESKRTKAFTNEWIEKLKHDMRAQQADIAVIVTETLPKDMDAFGFKDGVWICKFSDVKPLAFLLRDSLLKIHNALITQENKGDKMQLLYDYLTANEFRQHIEAVAEGFLALRKSIISEKMQMEKIWKEREKQLDKVLLNTTQFYGSIKGIAGNAVGDLKMLE